MRSSRESGTDSSGGVLIVGAGPTGLTLANALASYGVPFDIIDQKAGPSQDSKGLALNLGTRYGLMGLGLQGQVGARGCELRRLNVFLQGRRFSSVNFSYLLSKLPALVTQPQAQTEQELNLALRGMGAGVKWSTRLVEISQDSDGVHSRFERASGRCTRQTHAFAVGCEGKASIVRESIGASFNGRDYAMHFVLGDFNAPALMPNNQADYHIHPETFFISIPIRRDVRRFVVKCSGPEPSRAPVASDIVDVVNRYLGQGTLSGEPLWLSRAPFYMRTASRLKHGRLFIAGDSAHLFSPIGGTGMNTGMQDALSLAWKLAWVARGYAGAALLDAYEEERLEVIQEAARATDAATCAIAGEPGGQALVDALRPIMKNRRQLAWRIPASFAGIGPRQCAWYAAKSITALPGVKRAGEICVKRLDLMQKARGGKASLVDAALLIVAHASDSRSHRRRVAALARLVARHRAVAPAIVYSASAFPVERSTYIVDGGEDASSSGLNMRPGALVMVAPDGYLCFSGTLEDLAMVEDLLQGTFGSNVSTKSQVCPAPNIGTPGEG